MWLFWNWRNEMSYFLRNKINAKKTMFLYTILGTSSIFPAYGATYTVDTSITGDISVNSSFDQVNVTAGADVNGTVTVAGPATVTVTDGIIRNSLESGTGNLNIIMTDGKIGNSFNAASSRIILGDSVNRLVISGGVVNGRIQTGSIGDYIELSGNATVGGIFTNGSLATNTYVIRDNALVKRSSSSDGWSIGGGNGDSIIRVEGGTIEGSVRPDAGVNQTYISGGTIGKDFMISPSAGASIILRGHDLLEITGGTLLGGIRVNPDWAARINIHGGKVGKLDFLDSNGASIFSSDADIINVTGGVLEGGVQVKTTLSGITVNLSGGTIGTTTGGFSFSGGNNGDSLTVSGSAKLLGGIQGGSGDDVFQISGGSIQGVISGGSGEDTLSASNGYYNVLDMEALTLRAGQLNIYNNQYDSLTNLEGGVIVPQQLSTTFIKDVVNRGTISLVERSGTQIYEDKFTVLGAYLGDGGFFVLDALMDPLGSSADQLIFQGTVSGNTILTIKGVSTESDIPGQDVMVIDTASSVADKNAFRLENPLVQIGLYNYHLDQRNNQWFLSALSDQMAPTVSGYSKNLISQYNYSRELLDFSSFVPAKNEWNSWGRYLSSSYDLRLGKKRNSNTFDGFQIGGDKRIFINNKTNEKIYVGALAGYGKSSLSYPDSFGGVSGSGWSGGVYGIFEKMYSPKSILRIEPSVIWGKQDSMANFYNLSGYNQKYSADIFGSVLGIKHTTVLENGWNFKPSIQLTYSHINQSKDFYDPVGLTIKANSLEGVYGKVSLELGKASYTESNKMLYPYLNLTYGHHLGGGVSAITEIQGTKFTEKLNSWTATVGAGITYEVSKRYSFQFEVNRMFGEACGWKSRISGWFRW